MLTPAQIFTLMDRQLLTDTVQQIHQRAQRALNRINQFVPPEHLQGMSTRLSDYGINISPMQLDRVLYLAPVARSELMDDYGSDVTETVIEALANIFLDSTYTEFGNTQVNSVMWRQQFIILLNEAILIAQF